MQTLSEPPVNGAATAVNSAVSQVRSVDNEDDGESEVTRLLCASAILGGDTFRDAVVRQVEDEHRATAPELGLDMPVLVRLCHAMKDRADLYRFAFAPLGALVAYAVYNIVVICLTAGRFEILILALTRSYSVRILLVTWFVASLLYFWRAYGERYGLASSFSRASFNLQAVCQRYGLRELPSSSNLEKKNLVIHRGFSPFLGAGVDLGSWSLLVNLTKPKQDGGSDAPITPVMVTDVYEAIRGGVDMLSMKRVRVKHCVFAHGHDIRNDRSILPDVCDPPMQDLDQARLNGYKQNIRLSRRYYEWIRVHTWNHEVVISFFVRCNIVANRLTLEVNQFALTPVKDDYRQIDALPPRQWSVLGELYARSLLMAPFAALHGLLFFMSKLSSGLSRLFGDREERERRKEIKRNPLYEYGPEQSIREWVSDRRFRHHFQKVDTVMYIQMVQRAISDAVIDLLDAHNIDTSDLKDRQAQILNQGIIVQSGNVEATSLAVGVGAQALSVKAPANARQQDRASGKET